jgi:integrase
MIWDGEISGFGLRVSPSGRKTYVLKYRVGGGRAGRVRWAVIGTHGSITPDQARDIARTWAADVAQGGDPAALKAEARNAPTVKELLGNYLSDHVEKKNKARTAADVRRLVNKIIAPALGTLKVADVTRGDVARFHNSLAASPYQANRALAALSKAFNLAEVWGMRPDGSNPCQKVERFKEKARERFLSASEFQALGKALSKAEREPLLVTGKDGRERLTKINPQAIYALRLLIFTGARVGEILSLRWEYVDREAGRASLPDSKTGKKVVQLPPPALEILGAIGCPDSGKGFVIRGGKGTDPERPLVNLKDPWAAIRADAGLEGVRLHDLRHAFASIAVAGGLGLPMIGALLGHRETKTTQRYAHIADDPQKAAASMIASRISDAMQGSEGGAEVIALPRKR